jgi:hypothetical protein
MNSDVIALIQSFAGITSLDVADAVRELKREGIHISSFKLRDLSELCFLIQHKCEKKKWSSTKCIWRSDIRGQVGCHSRFWACFERDHFLLAFKLLGYNYKVFDEILHIGGRTVTERTFSVAGFPSSPLKWCKLLKQLYEKKHDKIKLLSLRNSRLRQEECEMLVLRRLF